MDTHTATYGDEPSAGAQTRQPMKGIYLARLDLSVPNHMGVHNKILGQIAALEKALGPIDGYFPRGLTIEKNGQPVSSFPDGYAAHFRFHQYGFYNQLKGMNLQADYFYIRHQLATPAFLAFVKTLRMDNPSAPILLEIPTYPYDLEQVGLKQQTKLLQDRLTRNRMHKWIDRVVTFSREDQIFGIPAIKTQNGIDLDRFPLIPPPKNQRGINLVGVANVSRWHGYDRIISGLHDYYTTSKQPEVNFHIIGDGEELPNLKALTSELRLNHRVYFHGAINGDALTEALNGMHIAVSSLAMHRLNTHTTNLKSREYCARGLPFINSHHETYIPSDFPFAFTTTGDDQPVNIEQIISHYKQMVHTTPLFRNELRAYAAQHLTWENKFSAVVDAILSVKHRSNKVS